MNEIKQAFLALPDTVIITDMNFYVFGFNRTDPFSGLRRGMKITHYMPDCTGETEDETTFEGRVYRRSVARVFEGGAPQGYVVQMADITEWIHLLEENRRKSEELARLTDRQALANAELEAYVSQAETLQAHAEQLRIAQSIHDDSGHAITALHTISQMCLQLCGDDGWTWRRNRRNPSSPVRARYLDLVDRGISICRKVSRTVSNADPATLREFLEDMRAESPFKVEVEIAGVEPSFALRVREAVSQACKEAYHNTLSHSLADTLRITALMGEDLLRIEIRDDGCFHGAFEKGFGLQTMEENVRRTGGTVRFETEADRGFGVVLEWTA